MAKGFDLMLDAGTGADVPLPTAALVRQTLQAMIATGEGDADYFATVRHHERLSGLNTEDVSRG